MKKICLFLMVLSLVFGSTAALAQEAKGMEAELTLHVSPEVFRTEIDELNALGIFGYDPEAIKAASEEMGRSTAALLDLLSVRYVAKGDDIRLSFLLKDKPIITVEEGYMADGQFAMVTNLFPSYAFLISEEDMAKSESENEKILKAVEEMLVAFVQIAADMESSMQSYAQPVQEGTFTVNGKTYDQKTVIEMSCEEFWAILNDGYTRIIPELEKLLVAYGMEEDLAAMEEAVTDAQSAPLPENMQGGVMTGEVYTNRENTLRFYETVTVKTQLVHCYGAITADENKMELTLLAGPATYADQTALEQAALEGAEDVWQLRVSLLPEEQIILQAEAVQGEKYQRHMLYYIANDSDEQLKYQYYNAKDGQPMAEAVLNCRFTDEEMVPVDVTGKQGIPYNKVMEKVQGFITGSENDEYDLLQILYEDASKAVNGVMIDAILAAPEEIRAYMDASTALQNAILYTIPTDAWQDVEPIEVPAEETSF